MKSGNVSNDVIRTLLSQSLHRYLQCAATNGTRALANTAKKAFMSRDVRCQRNRSVMLQYRHRFRSYIPETACNLGYESILAAVNYEDYPRMLNTTSNVAGCRRRYTKLGGAYNAGGEIYIEV